MKILPENWIETKLENVLEKILGGGTPSKMSSSFFSGAIPFMTVKDMKERFPSDTIDHISEEAVTSSATTILPADTLIVATRMSLGKIVRPIVSTAINQDLKALFPFGEINKTYLEYFWRSRSNEINALGTGTTVKGIRLDDIKNLKIPLAPSAEQKRISDKLDLLLNHVDTCRTRLRSIKSILKRFRQSVLTAATSGQLTPEFRRRNIGVDTGIFSYPLVPFEKLVISVRGGSNEVPSNDPSSFPILRSSSVRQGELNLLDVKFLTSHQSKRDSNFIENEDVLFTRLNGSAEYVGNCVVVTAVPKNTYQYPDRLFCAKLNASLDPEYCMYAFSTPSVRMEIERRAKSTAGHKRISIQDLKEIEIRLPGIAEQQAIVLRVKGLFAFADRLEARLATACTAVDRLTPALLAKAFRGELVPQDPADEPASELLARLAASRVAEVAKPRRVRTAKA